MAQVCIFVISLTFPFLHVVSNINTLAFPGGTSAKEPACQCRSCISVPPLGWKDPLWKGMATHSSILAWRIPRIEEPGRL